MGAHVAVDEAVDTVFRLIKIRGNLAGNSTCCYAVVTEALYCSFGSVRDSCNDATEDEDDDPGEGQENAVNDSVALFLAACEKKSEESCSERDDTCSEQDTERNILELVNFDSTEVALNGFDREKRFSDCEVDRKC